MLERSIPYRFDRYLRREDSVIAKTFRMISPNIGQSYRQDDRLLGEKRVSELVIAIPLALATLPVMTVLAAGAIIEDRGPPIYKQRRYTSDGKEVTVYKIRCMREDADTDVNGSLTYPEVYGKESDPRNTKLGRFMRRFELEEIPQLWQVIFGQLSLVDFRAAAQYTVDYVKQNRPQTFNEWWESYKQAKPGLISLNSVVSTRKNDAKRHHYDMLYARKASLGLNLYILYRTSCLMKNKLFQWIISHK